jgi:hypothetical protein
VLAVVDDASQVSPGLAGFLTVFLLALATVVLVRSMVNRLRKVRYGPGPGPDQAPDGDRPTDGRAAGEPAADGEPDANG